MAISFPSPLAGYPAPVYNNFVSPFSGPSPGSQGPVAFAPRPNPLQTLEQILSSLTRTSGGWAQFMGGPPPQFNSFTPSGPGATTASQSSTGGYGSNSSPLPPQPTDPQEFASYLQAQLAGGSLQGQTGIAQKDAIPGSRFGQVQNSDQWNAAVARDYTYQFAAYATGANPLTAQGLQQGANAMPMMSPDARLFTQVAAVFKGDLLGGPGQYNNAGLKQLLLSHGDTSLADQPGVGQTDVQTIGAVTAAMNNGTLTLNDVINSGTIDNLPRYHQIINYVSQGGFAQTLGQYESAPT